MIDRRATGNEAENSAQRLLSDNGMHPVTHNYRCRGGEIDLVMRDDDTLVFVEVRYRRNNRFGGALASVDERKRARLVHAAQHYLQRNSWSGPCRFDVVAIDGDSGTRWIRDAFSAA